MVDGCLDAVHDSRVKNYRQMYWKIRKINWASTNQATSFKLGKYNLLTSISTFSVIHKLCKTQFWNKLFAIGFPYKHCNFWPPCLSVKMASKTVIMVFLINRVSVSLSVFAFHFVRRSFSSDIPKKVKKIISLKLEWIFKYIVYCLKENLNNHTFLIGEFYSNILLRC